MTSKALILAEDYRNLGKPINFNQVGARLDCYLAKGFLFHSRIKWAGLIKEEQVLVNNLPKKPAYKIQENDQITYYMPQEVEPVVDQNIRVVWEQSGVIAVYKPSNLPMHEGGVYRLNTFSTALSQLAGPEWSAVHRLDRETSGLVLCAKEKETRNELSHMIRNHHMTKIYYAIAIGNSARKEWVVDQPLGELTTSKLRIKQGVLAEGSASLTHFAVLAEKPGFTLLQVTPKTGRTHQIRVHAAWSNLPLVGDKKYTLNEDIALEYLDDGFTPRVEKACYVDRLCLHAARLSFVHPIDQSNCSIDEKMPEDMQRIWDEL